MRRFESTGDFREFHSNNIFRSIMTQLLAFSGLLSLSLDHNLLVVLGNDHRFSSGSISRVF